jgi:hypothetical protein
MIICFVASTGIYSSLRPHLCAWCPITSPLVKSFLAEYLRVVCLFHHRSVRRVLVAQVWSLSILPVHLTRRWLTWRRARAASVPPRRRSAILFFVTLCCYPDCTVLRSAQLSSSCVVILTALLYPHCTVHVISTSLRSYPHCVVILTALLYPHCTVILAASCSHCISFSLQFHPHCILFSLHRVRWPVGPMH